MRPGVYYECLEIIRERDELPPSEMHRVMLADVIAIETELKANLPDQYENFLIEVGVGHEHGGLAYWHHLDITRPGNLLNVNEKLKTHPERPKHYPKRLLVFFDPCDEQLYGFMKNGTDFSPEVLAWSDDDQELHTVAATFEDFLDHIVDCSLDEIEEAERRYERVA